MSLAKKLSGFFLAHIVVITADLLSLDELQLFWSRSALDFFAPRFLWSPLVSWTKHGCTSLLIPGHGPPLNITIFGDISINPGPENLIQNSLKWQNENLPNILDLHMNTRVITYTRAELLGIRRASRSFVCGSVLHVLKLNGLLRFRGCRAGRRKISVRISDRVSHTTCRDRTTSRTSVLVPIVPEQRFRVGSYLKFCSLNARSVRN